jgi:hypothetical protein
MTSHGHARRGHRSPTYVSWQAMIARCTRPEHPRWACYGGRGVQVDPVWVGAGGFVRFLEDVGCRPPELTLDRIDVDGHYTAGNVRWASLRVQRWNRRDMLERVENPDGCWPVAPPPWGVNSGLTLAGRSGVDPSSGQGWPF